MIAIYIAAVAAANLTVAHFGPVAVPYTSFFLVGFVIVARDVLHDRWHASHMTPRMGAVILAGGAVSAAVNLEALPIAIASMAAFVASETANALVYEPLRRRGVPWVGRVNTGNVANAAVDSVVFVALAFGWLWPIIALQIAAKLAGGLMWSLVVSRVRGALGGAA